MYQKGLKFNTYYNIFRFGPYIVSMQSLFISISAKINSQIWGQAKDSHVKSAPGNWSMSQTLLLTRRRNTQSRKQD